MGVKMPVRVSMTRSYHLPLGAGLRRQGGAQHPAELLVHLRDLGTNNHLILAVCLGNAHNTGQALDSIGIGF